jgi:hypothetical protein
MLISGTSPEEHLLFRCHLDAFVEIPNLIAQDKKTFRDNILQLMEAGHSWTLRTILTGVSPEAGGTLVPEYPDKLIRESINNAFAHRDYSIDRPVQLTIKPRQSLSIRNPGQLPAELVLERPADPIPVRRIFANPRAPNPRLADILKLHNKWEGKGIGMSDLVNCALANEIDVPYFTFHSAGELSLTIPAGINHGEVLRVRGKGVPDQRGKRGDLLVRVDIVMPTKISILIFQCVKAMRATRHNFFYFICIQDLNISYCLHLEQKFITSTLCRVSST